MATFTQSEASTDRWAKKEFIKCNFLFGEFSVDLHFNLSRYFADTARCEVIDGRKLLYEWIWFCLFGFKYLERNDFLQTRSRQKFVRCESFARKPYECPKSFCCFWFSLCGSEFLFNLFCLLFNLCRNSTLSFRKRKIICQRLHKMLKSLSYTIDINNGFAS